MKNHKCNACGFETTKKSNFNRHLMTKKHKQNITGDNKKEFICEYCSKSFRTNPHMRRHQLHFCKFN